ncbi:hypothetical protein TIFTF001_004186 [Ficus carica]|uniref:F-box domain-containing protein n=1 Tax=Ficus carica TaxID=3494 RepID=A0AA87ZF68_FICCA|nr:hypothetical protein TIFTF001_004186 [Ficus carica]
MSTTAATTEAPPAILIPSLPNDVALQCLARVPRQYHPVLAAVSKPIRSLISSPEFFAARSALNCTEILPYLRIRNGDCQAEGWFTIYGRPNPNSDPDNIIIAHIPGVVPDNDLDWSECAAVGPKIYVLGSRTHVWIFDCRFHTWERGPSMPTALRGITKTVILGTKIFVIRWPTEGTPWADVFDTVAGQWEALPSVKFTASHQMVGGCAVRGGKVCVWVAGEELRFDPETKAWEVLESGIGLGVHWGYQMCEVNGVLCCYDYHRGLIKCFDEITGVWKKLKFANKGLRGQWQRIRMSNVGGSLVVLGSAVLRNMGRTMAIWYLEIEVKKDQDGDFRGEVLWSVMVHSTRMWSLHMMPIYTCTSVSL